jgi:hypothetical protein
VHYDLDKKLKMIVHDWMELVLLVVTASNEELHKKIEEVQIHDTP